MTQVLARKWRPRTFAEMVGQEHVVQALENALGQQRLHHAYLFTGTRGVGKTTLARILAKALNCETGVTAAPCGRCSTCVEIDAGRFVDLIELDAASNTQVENMRELLENALYAPTAARYKVYIIDEAHMLSRHAFNAMLKTLEEPPEHVKFILATTEPQRMPVTVLSRCLQFNLRQIPEREIETRLRAILQAEGVDYEPAALTQLARAARGSLRDALSLTDQAIAHSGGKVTLESVGAMLGTTGQDHLFAILRALAARNGAALLAEADRMAERSLSFEQALQDLATLLHRIALLQTVPEAVAKDAPERAAFEDLARQFAPEDLQLYYQIAVQGRAELGLAPDEYAGFTMTLLRMLAFAPSEETQAAETHSPPHVPHSSLPASSADSKKKQADPSWPELVERLGLSGMTLMLARHCELVACDASRVELKLAQVHQRLLDASRKERIREALERYFGNRVRLAISLTSNTEASPAALAEQGRRQRQAQAIAAIEQDPFVRELVENFDGRIVESSIRPLNGEG